MPVIYRTIPHIRPGQVFELMGRRAVYLGGSGGVHEFRTDGELDTRSLTDAQLVQYVDAGALRMLK